MRGVLLVSHQLDQRPEGVLLAQEHQQDGHNLLHAQAVPTSCKTQMRMEASSAPSPHSHLISQTGSRPAELTLPWRGPPEMPSGLGELRA